MMVVTSGVVAGTNLGLSSSSLSWWFGHKIIIEILIFYF